MAVTIEKIPGGFSIDGFELKSGKCGCTSVAKCCYSWSKVKKKDDRTVEFAAKTTASDTSDHYNRQYTVAKDGTSRARCCCWAPAPWRPSCAADGAEPSPTTVPAERHVSRSPRPARATRAPVGYVFAHLPT